MAYNRIFLLLVTGTVIFQLARSQSCTQEYENFRTCVKSKMNDPNDPSSNSNKRQQMQTDFRSCCTQNGCQDPYPSQTERQAREQCLRRANGQVRLKLEGCVKSSASDFKLPSDSNNDDCYWNYIMLRSLAAMLNIGDNPKNRGAKQKYKLAAGDQPPNDVCGTDNNKKERTSQCLSSKGVFNHSAANSSWRKRSCSIKQQCNQVSEQCQQKWDNSYKPRICDCVISLANDGSLKTIQDNYVQCVRSKGVKVDNNDDGRRVVAKFLDGWCPSKNASASRYPGSSDPCKRRGQGGSSQTGASAQASVSDDGTSEQQLSAASNPLEGLMGLGGGSGPLSNLAGGLGGGGGNGLFSGLFNGGGAGGLGGLLKGGGLGQGQGLPGLLNGAGAGGLGNGLGSSLISSPLSAGPLGDSGMLGVFTGSNIIGSVPAFSGKKK